MGNVNCALPITHHLFPITRLSIYQDFGEMEHLGPGIPAPPQPPFDVEHAAQVAEHYGVGAGAGDVGTLLVGDPGRDLAELDGEGATEPATLVRRSHFPEGEPGYLRQQLTRLRLHPQLAQSGTGVVIGDAALETAANLAHF